MKSGRVMFTVCGISTQRVEQVRQEDDIREAVFRYQFQTNASQLESRAASYFLSMNKQDPSEGFLKRFEGHLPPVKGRSQCTSGRGGVFDKATGKRGLHFYLGKIKWVNDTEVEVEGGYFEGGKSVSGNTYYLSYQNGRWNVVKDVMHWIS